MVLRRAEKTALEKVIVRYKKYRSRKSSAAALLHIFYCAVKTVICEFFPLINNLGNSLAYPYTLAVGCDAGLVCFTGENHNEHTLGKVCS